MPEDTPIGPYTANVRTTGLDAVDLVTFPEAFLPKDDLVSTLNQLPDIDSLGCIHVGLRPSIDASNHLFTVADIENLVGILGEIEKIDQSDLGPFSKWLKVQRTDSKFNLGCLFTIDARQKIRICLHPKIVRARVETHALHEHHMVEADLLSLVTLVPTDRSYLTVTLQPVLCSDLLNIETDRPGAHPVEAVNTEASCFDSTPPDHIDIVSVATCTPQINSASSLGSYRQWHQEFRDSFKNAASDDRLSRHHHSAIVLSNFQFLPGNKSGGLSGAFIPVPIDSNELPPYVKVFSWGRDDSTEDKQNRWSTPDDASNTKLEWSSMGYIASLCPTYEEHSTQARMLGFTISRLPRERSRWRSQIGFIDYQLRTASEDSMSGALVFRKQEEK